MYAHLLDPPAVFDSPSDFLRAAAGYFKWCDDTPLKEEQLFSYKGLVTRADRDKMRPYTKRGLATHLNIPASRLDGYKKRGEEWAEAMEMIDQIIYNQKFEGAAGGLLNSTIIIRDLELVDKRELGGIPGQPLEINARDQLLDKLTRFAPAVADDELSGDAE